MNHMKGFIYGIISSTTFGLIPLFALPIISAGVDIETMMVYRFGLSALFVGLLLLIKKESFKVTKQELGTLTLLGLFYGLTAILLTTSYLYIPSGVATTIHFLYPVIVSMIMAFLFKERLGLPTYGAFLVAFLGVFLLTYSTGEGDISTKGLLYVISTVFTYALYIVGVNKSNVKQMDGLKLTFYVLLVDALLFLSYALLSKGTLTAIPSVQTGLNLLLLAIVPTLVSDLALVLAVQNIGSTKTSVLGCMEPVTAVLVGALHFGEHIGVTQLSGVIFILAAVTAVILLSARNSLPLEKVDSEQE